MVEDVAVLAVELADAAQRRDALHDLGDELVRAHAARPPLVGHEDLVGGHALLEGLREAVEDIGLVVQDEVEAEIHHRLLGGLVAQALERLGQRLPGLVVVLHEREQSRQPSVRGGHRPGVPIVVDRAEMHVAVDQAGQHVLAGGIDGALRGRQHRLGPQCDDLAVLHRNCGLQYLSRGDDAAAPDDQIY